MFVALTILTALFEKGFFLKNNDRFEFQADIPEILSECHLWVDIGISVYDLIGFHLNP